MFVVFFTHSLWMNMTFWNLYKCHMKRTREAQVMKESQSVNSHKLPHTQARDGSVVLQVQQGIWWLLEYHLKINILATGGSFGERDT